MRHLLVSAALLLCGCSVWSSPPTPSSIAMAAWNIEHLAEDNDSGCRPRDDEDYRSLAAHIAAIRPEVVALQEIESEAAAYRVFDPADYVVMLEERTGSGQRPQCRGLDGRFLNRQATGFAIRRDIRFERHADLTALSLGDPDLRSGVDVTVFPRRGAALRLLSVHLKSGCSSGDHNAACATFFQQVPIVEEWIDARASEGVDFAVLGDFNRRLAMPGDPVWRDWDDAEPADADLALAAGEAAAQCDPRYADFIDHIVLGRHAAARMSGFREIAYPDERLSDHCLILATIRLR